MKKLFSLILLVSAVSLFISCSNQEEPTMQGFNQNAKEKHEMTQLVKKLEAYNASFRQTNGQTRSFGGWFRKILRIVNADAVGAICGAYFGPWGALAGGAVASAYAYTTEEGMLSPNPMTRGGIVGYDDPMPMLRIKDMNLNALQQVVIPSNITGCNDSVGYHHNSILMSLQRRNKLVANVNVDSLVNNICMRADNVFPNGRGTTTNADLLLQLNFSYFQLDYANMATMETFEDFIDAYIGLYPDMEEEIYIIAEFVQTLCELNPEEDEEEYTEGVLEIIGESEVSDAIKARLGEAVITGYASYKLWDF